MSPMSRENTGWRALSQLVLACLLVLALAGSAGASTADDEKQILVFDSMAAPQGDHWIVPVRGRVYELNNTTVRKALFAALLQEGYGLRETPETANNFDERIRWFVASGESEQQLVTRIGEHPMAIDASDSNGYFDATMAIPRRADTSARTVSLHATLGKDDRFFEGTVVVPTASAVMIVSDIDDTIKVSHVTDTAVLLDYTFYRDYEAVPGMAALYRRWSDAGAAFHYVSSSPWQLYVPIRDFMLGAGFPLGAMHLKRVHVTDGTFLDLFKSGTETKPARIETLLDRFPGHHFVLVGDSGEEDPEVYALLLRQNPEQVVGVYIRNVTGESPSDSRFQRAFAGIERTRWGLFVRPADLNEVVDRFSAKSGQH
jgi:hypothetical protein